MNYVGTRANAIWICFLEPTDHASLSPLPNPTFVISWYILTINPKRGEGVGLKLKGIYTSIFSGICLRLESSAQSHIQKSVNDG